MDLVDPAFSHRALALSLALLAGCGGVAPAAPGAAGHPVTQTAPGKGATAWASLQAQVGRSLADRGADFLREGALAERLRGLLGPANYPVLLENLGVSGPLRQEGGLLYITGHRPHSGDTEAAAVVIHPAADAVSVWLLTGGEEWEVQDARTPKALPAEVAALMKASRR